MCNFGIEPVGGDDYCGHVSIVLSIEDGYTDEGEHVKSKVLRSACWPVFDEDVADGCSNKCG